MHAAYKELGSYRAAAGLCGTTDETVKRAVARATSAEGQRALGNRLWRGGRRRTLSATSEVLSTCTASWRLLLQRR